MTDVGPVIVLSPRDYDAVLFDLDGVLTRTAAVHAAAWKELFDGFPEQRATEAGEPFVPFDLDKDYALHVGGKPRFDGVAAFLAELPIGTPGDGPGAHSMHALGNLKNRHFKQLLVLHGVEPYEAAISLVRTLRTQEIKTAGVLSGVQAVTQHLVLTATTGMSCPTSRYCSETSNDGNKRRLQAQESARRKGGVYCRTDTGRRPA